MSKRNTYLDAGSEDEEELRQSDSDAEDARDSRFSRFQAKRRKLSPGGGDDNEEEISSEPGSDDADDSTSRFDSTAVPAALHEAQPDKEDKHAQSDINEESTGLTSLAQARQTQSRHLSAVALPGVSEEEQMEEDEDEDDADEEEDGEQGFMLLDEDEDEQRMTQRKVLTRAKLERAERARRKTGVLYISRVPPFMKPTTVRQLLAPHGTVLRIFLTPEPAPQYQRRVRAGGNRKKSYVDGWVEFERKRDARRCAELLNGQAMGGRKRGFYHDDLWTLRYLHRFKWDDLMEQVQGEAREREGRLQAEIARERRQRTAFTRNADRARVERGIEARRAMQHERRAKKAEGQQRQEQEQQDGKGSAAVPSHTLNSILDTTTTTNTTATATPSQSLSADSKRPRRQMEFAQNAVRAPASHFGTADGSKDKDKDRNIGSDRQSETGVHQKKLKDKPLPQNQASDLRLESNNSRPKKAPESGLRRTLSKIF